MSLEKTDRVKRGRLRVTLQRDYELHFLDFFVDHLDKERDIRIGPTRTEGLLDYISYRPSTLICPLCNLPEFKQEEGMTLKRLLLKQFGRRTFCCNHCGFRDTIKLFRWEWETIVTFLAVFCVVVIAAVHWLSGGY